MERQCLTTKAFSDAALLVAIRQGDQDAVVELYARYERPAFALALRISGSADAAEEAVQRAFCRIWSTAARFLAEGNPRGWMLKIVARESLMALKGRRRQKALREREKAKPRDELCVAAPAAAERQEIHGALQAEVARLPGAMRQLIALYFGAGFSQHEISRMLSVPQRTVSKHLEVALERLRVGLARAGISDTAGGLRSGLLEAAVLAGLEVPARLGPRVLTGMRAPPVAEGLGSAGPTLARAGLSLVAAATVAAGVCLCAGQAFFGWQDPVGAVEARSRNESAWRASSTVQEVGAGTPAFERRWEFDEPQGWAGLGNLQGDWHWVAGGGPDGSGCMEAFPDPGMTSVSLQLPAALPTLCLRWQEQALPWPDSKVGRSPAVFLLRHTSDGVRSWRTPMLSHEMFLSSGAGSGAWRTCVAYLSWDRMDLWIDGQRVQFIPFRSQGRGLVFYFNGRIRMDSLQIRSLALQEFPDAGSCLKAPGPGMPSDCFGRWCFEPGVPPKYEWVNTSLYAQWLAKPRLPP